MSCNNINNGFKYSVAPQAGMFAAGVPIISTPQFTVAVGGTRTKTGQTYNMSLNTSNPYVQNTVRNTLARTDNPMLALNQGISKMESMNLQFNR